MYKINCIIPFYIGPNRGYANYQNLFKIDPLFFIKIHLECVSICKGINLFTFIINDDISEDLKKCILELCNIENVEVIFRKNNGFSYGAWNDVIKTKLNYFDYFFMLEDDYLPVYDNFYEYFIEKSSYETPYICGYVEERNGIRFASSSNGLIRSENCKIVYEKYNEIFFINNSNSYELSWDTQINFYKYFLSCGFGIDDILDKYSTVHMLNCHINQVIHLGDTSLPYLIQPIQI